MEIVRIKLADLEPNTGQIPGLPMNPRQWTATDVDRIAASLTETPELFEARPLLVYQHEGKYIILGGNLRHEGAKRNKMKEVPAIILPATMPVEKLKEIVIKDNGSFGAWDYDNLANEWSDLPLPDWGVPAWKEEGPIEFEDEGPVPPEELENPYSTKLEAPIYEIRGENPSEDEIVDTEKVDELLAGIDAADIPERKRRARVPQGYNRKHTTLPGVCGG